MGDNNSMTILCYITPIPLTISGLQLWLDGNDPAGNNNNPSNGTAISAWVDKSGLKRNATQASGTLQPAYYSNVQAGKGVIRFDGSNDTLATAAFSSVIAIPYTQFVVLKTTVYKSFNVALNDVTTLSSMGVHGDSSKMYLFNGAVANVGITNTSFNLLYTKWNGTSTDISVNGGATSTVNPGTTRTSLSGLRIGANTDLSNAFAGDIAEIIIYNRTLTASEISTVNNYLKNKWGV